MSKTNYDVLRQVIYNDIEKEAEKRKAASTKTVPFDKDVYNKGMAWYDSGLSLDEAPEEFKNNIHFVNGYERGKRLAKYQETQNNSDKHR